MKELVFVVTKVSFVRCIVEISKDTVQEMAQLLPLNAPGAWDKRSKLRRVSE